MTKSNATNEDINEELSTDDLKDVCGGLTSAQTIAGASFRVAGNRVEGSSYGWTRKDWELASRGKEMNPFW